LDNWGSNPTDFESVIAIRKIPFREKFREPEYPINDSSETYAKLLELGATRTEAYITLLSTDYQLLANTSKRHPSLRPWRWFENEIVLQAIGFGLLRPTPKECELYPQLTKYLDPDEGEVEIDDSKLRSLIFKTCGTEVGASIYNFGHTQKGSFSVSRSGSRQSGSFDGAVDFGNKNTAGGASSDPSGGWAGEIDSGDYAEEVGSD
jgi:hypothetical protein